MIRNIFLILFIVTLSSSSGFAQGATAGGGGGPKTQLSKIFVAGLAGGVLGLSTLSFYGKPQAHLSNIAIGFTLGILGGAIFTTYDTVQDPQKLYSDYDLPTQRKSNDSTIALQAVGYSFDF